MVFGGDFNIDIKRDSSIIEFFKSLNFKNSIDRQQSSTDSGSQIDLIFANFDYGIFSDYSENIFSYHKPIVFSIQKNIL